jgi:hypothetical protein
MMNFNYLSPDRSSREVGTAEAVIRKDMSGRVTVQVLAERGKLENRRTNEDIYAPNVAYTYRQIEGATGTYTTKSAE